MINLIHIMQNVFVKILFLILLFSTAILKGQSLHYSQFFSSPLNLNPALTGGIEGDWRFISNYRSQGQYFSNPLNTLSLSFDKPVFLYKEQAGVGVMYTKDYSSGLSIPSDRFYLSMASAVKVSEKSLVGLGLQLGWVYKSFSYSDLTFPEQYDRDTGGFNESLPISEEFDNTSSSYFDINAGLMWNYQINKHLLSLGVATYHLNQPMDNFLDEESRVKIRTNGHGSFKYILKNGFYLLPRSYFTVQNKMSEFVWGSNVGMENKVFVDYVKNLHLGVYYKNAFNSNLSSLIFMAGASIENWTTTISYDIDIGGSKEAGILTEALEFSIIYQRPSSKLNKVSVPCIRY